MVIAKKNRKESTAVAQEIIADFSHEFIKEIQIAGPGFLNAYFKDEAIQDLAHDLIIIKNFSSSLRFPMLMQ